MLFLIFAAYCMVCCSKLVKTLSAAQHHEESVETSWPTQGGSLLPPLRSSGAASIHNDNVDEVPEIYLRNNQPSGGLTPNRQRSEYQGSQETYHHTTSKEPAETRKRLSNNFDEYMSAPYSTPNIFSSRSSSSNPQWVSKVYQGESELTRLLNDVLRYQSENENIMEVLLNGLSFVTKNIPTNSLPGSRRHYQDEMYRDGNTLQYNAFNPASVAEIEQQLNPASIEEMKSIGNAFFSVYNVVLDALKHTSGADSDAYIPSGTSKRRTPQPSYIQQLPILSRIAQQPNPTAAQQLMKIKSETPSLPQERPLIYQRSNNISNSNSKVSELEKYVLSPSNAENELQLKHNTQQHARLNQARKPQNMELQYANWKNPWSFQESPLFPVHLTEGGGAQKNNPLLQNHNMVMLRRLNVVDERKSSDQGNAVVVNETTTMLEQPVETAALTQNTHSQMHTIEEKQQNQTLLHVAPLFFKDQQNHVSALNQLLIEQLYSLQANQVLPSLPQSNQQQLESHNYIEQFAESSMEPHGSQYNMTHNKTGYPQNQSLNRNYSYNKEYSCIVKSEDNDVEATDQHESCYRITNNGSNEIIYGMQRSISSNKSKSFFGVDDWSHMLKNELDRLETFSDNLLENININPTQYVVSQTEKENSTDRFAAPGLLGNLKNVNNFVKTSKAVIESGTTVLNVFPVAQLWKVANIASNPAIFSSNDENYFEGRSKQSFLPPPGSGKPSVTCAVQGMTCCVPSKAAGNWKENPPYLNNNKEVMCRAVLRSMEDALCATTSYVDKICGLIVAETGDFVVYRHIMVIPNKMVNNAICECYLSKTGHSGEKLKLQDGYSSWEFSKQVITAAEEQKQLEKKITKEIESAIIFTNLLNRRTSQIIDVLDETLNLQ